jgi:hypothetical protein
MFQFFENSLGELSMPRLCMFIACITSSLAFLWMAGSDKLGAEIFGLYCATWGGTYVYGKKLDRGGDGKP